MRSHSGRYLLEGIDHNGNKEDRAAGTVTPVMLLSGLKVTMRFVKLTPSTYGEERGTDYLYVNIDHIESVEQRKATGEAMLNMAGDGTYFVHESAKEVIERIREVELYDRLKL